MKSLRVEETQNTLIISTNIQEMLSSFVMFPAPQKKESPNLDVIDIFLDAEVAVSALHYPLNTGPGHPALRLSAHLQQYHVSETLHQLVSC